MADKIKELLAMDDAGLSKVFGFTDKLADAKKDLGEMDKLTGDARTEAEDRLRRMFEPSVYPGDFKWITEDAQRNADKAAKKAACNCDNETGNDLLDPEMYPDLED